MADTENKLFTSSGSQVPSPAGGGGMGILVFKTNLTNADHIGVVGPALSLHPDIIQWNVDLHDCDNILRVVSENIQAIEVQQIILNAGYVCEELY